MKIFKLSILLFLFVFIFACSSSSPNQETRTDSKDIKALTFSWTDLEGSTHYKLLENPDGISGFTQVGNNIAPGVQTVKHVVPLYLRTNAQYIIQSCIDAVCSDLENINISTEDLNQAIGYFKASNTNADDIFSTGLSISEDGTTLAVGALRENSNATGINGNQDNNNAIDSGAVYVFVRNDDLSWSQQAYLKASNTGDQDLFGLSLSLSADGNTLAASAPAENSNAAGINGEQNNEDLSNSGAVYIFTRSGDNWQQEAYIKASNPSADDYFGNRVSLSNDGNTLAVGAFGEDSNATSINGDGTNNSASDAGAAYVYTRSGSTWTQEAYIKSSNSEINDHFGIRVSLSGDGNTLAVGAFGEQGDSASTLSTPNNNAGPDTGAVYIYTRSAPNTWTESAYLKASNADIGDYFGARLSLNKDGNTLAIVAYYEDSSATGINGAESDNSATDSGAVYIFTYNNTSWTQQAYIKASNTDVEDFFGSGDISLSANGNILAVSSPFEDSSSAGINANQNSNAGDRTGAVFVYTRSSGVWSQQAYLKSPNPDNVDYFSSELALSADGQTLAIGANEEDSASTGIGGSQDSNAATDSGALYLY